MPQGDKAPRALHASQPTSGSRQHPCGLAATATLSKLVLALSGGMLASVAHAQAAQACTPTTILHVASDAAADGSGQGWDSPMTLHRALAKANTDVDPAACYELRLKQGVYKPAELAESPEERSIQEAVAATFQIQRPMTLKGGYTGQAEQRTTEPEKTVLSGDLQGNDNKDANGITLVARLPSFPSEAPGLGDIKGINSNAVLTVGTPTGPGLDVLRAASTQAVETERKVWIEGLTVTGAWGGSGLACMDPVDITPTATQSLAQKSLPQQDGMCSLHLKKVRFSGNFGPFGGGVSTAHASGADLLIEDSVFSGNQAYSGGALAVVGFFSNEEKPFNGTAVIRDSAFTDNQASMFGGALGVFATGPSNTLKLSIERSRLSRNSVLAQDAGNVQGTIGGAIAILGNRGAFQTVDSTFEENTAGFAGGAIGIIAADTGLTAQIKTSTFQGNSALLGGALANISSVPYDEAAEELPPQISIDNSTFTGNAARIPANFTDFHAYGGAIVNFPGTLGAQSSLAVSNSTFAGNTADTQGNTVANIALPQSAESPNTNRSAPTGKARATITSSILWPDADAPGSAVVNATAHAALEQGFGELTLVDPATNDAAQTTVSHSIVQKGWTASGTGNSAADPLLGPLQNNGGLTLTMRPGQGSSALSAVACSVTASTTDQRGLPRTPNAEGNCDIGAVQLQKYTLATQVTGNASSGVIQGVGDCTTAQCTAIYTESPTPSTVTLTAAPAQGYRFTGWTGACMGNTSSCTVTMDASRSVSASFAPISGTGNTPTGIPVDLVLGGEAQCTLDAGSPRITEAPSTGGPQGFTFPYGQIAFDASGCQSAKSLDITVTLNTDTPIPAKAVLFKRIGNEWKPWPGTISGTTVRFSVTDSTDASTAAQTGDNDPRAGFIKDPLLIAVPKDDPVVVNPEPKPEVKPVPTLSQWALMLLGSLLAALTLPALRRRTGDR